MGMSDRLACVNCGEPVLSEFHECASGDVPWPVELLDALEALEEQGLRPMSDAELRQAIEDARDLTGPAKGDRFAGPAGKGL